MFEWDTFVCWFGGCYHGGYTTRPGWASPPPPTPPPNAGLPASRWPSTFRAVRVCWCLSLPFSILFLFSLAFPLVITLELFTRLIHSSTVTRHLSNTHCHWLDSRGAHRHSIRRGSRGGGERSRNLHQLNLICNVCCLRTSFRNDVCSVVMCRDCWAVSSAYFIALSPGHRQHRAQQELLNTTHTTPAKTLAPFSSTSSSWM